MIRRSSFPFAAAALLVSALVFANEPTTQPSKVRVKLVYPYSRIQETLTSDQRSQILEIRREIRTQVIALQQQERARCMALLTDDQRALIEQIEAIDTANRKAREAERRAAEDQAGSR